MCIAADIIQLVQIIPPHNDAIYTMYVFQPSNPLNCNNELVHQLVFKKFIAVQEDASKNETRNILYIM